MSAGAAVAPDVDLKAVGDRLRESFEQAAEGRTRITRHLALAGQTLELEFAGEAMVASVLPALSHLSTGGHTAEPDLRIRIWDMASTGSPLPDLPPTVLGRTVHDRNRWVSVRPWESSLSMLETGTGEALYCVDDARQMVAYLIAHPLSELLGWWFSHSGLYLVHSAAVGTEAGGVLIAGPSGAGKSTSALACVKAGLRFVGDDTVLVGRDPPAAHCLYCSARADLKLLARYPAALPRLDLPSGEEKAAAFFDRELLRDWLPLRAIVLPRVKPGGRSHLRPERPGLALLRLAPEAVLRQRHAAERSLEVLGGLVRRLPVHALDVGDDLERIPGLLARLIEEPSACA